MKELERSTLPRTGSSSPAAFPQQTTQTCQAEKDVSVSNPGPENEVLRDLNPSSNMPPPTDRGDIGPVWYSFDLAHKRIQVVP